MTTGNGLAAAPAMAGTDGGVDGYTGIGSPSRSTNRPDSATLIRSLAELYPHTFAAERWEPHRPLKIGIRDDLIASGVVTPLEASIALRAYGRRRMYLVALAAGGARRDLNGHSCGDIAPEAMEWARVQLGHLDAKAVELAARARNAHQAAHTERKPSPSPPPAAAPQRLGLADLRRAAQERRTREART